MKKTVKRRAHNWFHLPWGRPLSKRCVIGVDLARGESVNGDSIVSGESDSNQISDKK